ncbi:MAG: extracellular solute-binding protein [Spirochaetia bacterium]|jgi:putative spermidine/putrescine transport system substrate-binding protein
MKKLFTILFVLAVVAASSFAAPKEIVFMDSQSGANFQQWFQTIALPAAEEFLGVKIKYVVGSDAEIIERMKAWKTGQGDITVLFPKSLALFIKTNQVKLDTLTTAKIPNMAKIDPDLQVSTEGIPVANKGAAYWWSTYALIYNSDLVKNPPKSWQEFYDRRAEWKGHIGFIRPDAKSSGGWRQPFAFLNAFCDFSKKFDPQAADFQDAWAKLKDFYTYCQLPLAAEPTNAFENFNAGDTWITVYAMDYSLWSARQGTMPPSTKAMFLTPGIDAGGQAYLVVPDNIPVENKYIAYKLINYLLSDDQQSRMVSTMWQYNSTLINDKVPGIVWEQIPRIEVAKKAAIPPERVNADAITYIKKNAVGIIP